VKFSKRLEEGKVRVAFWGESDEVELAHVRHPLVLLARWLAREPLAEIPFCRAIINVVETPTLLVWAIGSLEGYTQRAELLCTTVDFESGQASSISSELAQEWVAGLAPQLDGVGVNSLDKEKIMSKGERNLISQFEDLTESFSTRNNLLREKAIQAVTTFADRKVGWLDQQLARAGLKNNIRNLYSGWRQRLESETKTKIEEIEQKSAVRSSLQVIGVIEIIPE
jgi:hypothetical protein